jgi:hypothetical protein
LGTRKEKTGIGWKERKEGAECAMRRERMEFAEILSEDGREIRWMKEEGKNRNRKGWAIEIKYSKFFGIASNKATFLQHT